MLLRNVYYVPTSHLNVVSCLRLDERHISILIADGRCSFHYRKERNRYLGSVQLHRKEILYLLLIQIPKSNNAKLNAITKGHAFKASGKKETAGCRSTADKEVWLRRMADANDKAIRYTISKGNYGMHANDRPSTTTRGTCVLAKQTRKPDKGELIKHSQEFTVHVENGGPLGNPTFGGKHYFIKMTTTPHRYVRAEPLKNKLDAKSICLNHIVCLVRHAEKQSNG